MGTTCTGGGHPRRNRRRHDRTRPLGIGPPCLAPLDAEREARAVEALAVLLRPLLADPATRLKGGVEGACDGPPPDDPQERQP
jgi:hypothetical protein